MFYLNQKQGRLTALLLFFISDSSLTKAQINLVQNSSFEQYTSCPIGGRFNPTNNAPSEWYAADKGFSSYYNVCAPVGYGNVPYTYYGYQNAHSGVSMCLQGFWYVTNSNTNVGSYIQSKLIDSLKKDSKYYAEFYVNAAKYGKYICNDIGLLLTKNKVYADTTTPPLSSFIGGNPQVLNYNNTVISDTNNWTKISAIFTANGGENYVTIGNFKLRNQTIAIQRSNVYYNAALYYIDDVSVIPLDSFNLKADAGRDTTIIIGDSAFIGSLTNGIDSVKWLNQNTGNNIDSTRPGFWVHPLVNTCYVLTQTVNGYTSSDTVCVNVQTVPLKFISFQVQLEPTPNPSKEGNVKLDWVTANEINVSHFYVQRSTPKLSGGRDFIIIHKEQAENKILNNYTFIDETPNEGVNYYRIVSVDRDGKISFSEVRELIIHHSSLNINVYPNPAKDVVNIECKEEIKEVKIFNTVGQQISHFVRNDGTNNHYQLSIANSQLPKGLYVLKIVMKNGEVKTEKLIVE